MGAAEKLAEKVQPIGESNLRPGEKLQGVVAASSAKVYGGKTFVVVVTDKRLAFQPTSTAWKAYGEAISVHPGQIAEYEFRGMAPRLFRGPLIAFSRVGFRVNIKTVDDRPFQLWGWTGRGVLGRIGGGEPQSEGVDALREWLDAIDMED